MPSLALLFAADSNLTVLAVAIVGMIGASVLGPIIVNRNNKVQKQLDWAREDQVAQRVQELADRQLEASKRVIEIAVENKAANEMTAHKIASVDGQLEVIHTLVNSQMTVARQAEFDALMGQLTVVRELVAFRLDAGQQPTPETLGQIDTLVEKTTVLKAELVERHRQDEVAQAQLTAHAAEGTAAQVQKDAADTQQAAAVTQKEAADTQILVAQGQADVAHQQAAVAARQSEVAEQQANANAPAPDPNAPTFGTG